jgi:diguanylate cyclase (GGDEF)-like protein
VAGIVITLMALTLAFPRPSLVGGAAMGVLAAAAAVSLARAGRDRPEWLLRGAQAMLLAIAALLLLAEAQAAVQPWVAATTLTAALLRWCDGWTSAARPRHVLATTSIAVASFAVPLGLLVWDSSVRAALHGSTGVYLLVILLIAVQILLAPRGAAVSALPLLALAAALALSAREAVVLALALLTGLELLWEAALGEARPQAPELAPDDAALPVWVEAVLRAGAPLLVLVFTGIASVAADLDALPFLPLALGLVSIFGIADVVGELRRTRATVEALEARQQTLAERARLDMLTGLPNRAALDARLHEEVQRALRFQQPLSLLFVDIDHFKRVNDTYGHAAGDKVLQALGGAIRHEARAGDFVARYGGEELVVLAPGTWAADALVLAERLRATVASIRVPAVPGRFTISVGVAGLPEHATTPTALLATADKALYLAKAAGRDRCVLWREEADAQSATDI